MTGWDVLNNVVNNFLPLTAMLFLLTTGIIFFVGFFRHGIGFVKYGFRQQKMADLSAKIDSLRAEVKTELETIKSSHFGHLNNFLTELTCILQDKGIISGENKARLDNQLRGM